MPSLKGDSSAEVIKKGGGVSHTPYTKHTVKAAVSSESMGPPQHSELTVSVAHGVLSANGRDALSTVAQEDAASQQNHHAPPPTFTPQLQPQYLQNPPGYQGIHGCLQSPTQLPIDRMAPTALYQPGTVPNPYGDVVHSTTAPTSNTSLPSPQLPTTNVFQLAEDCSLVDLGQMILASTTQCRSIAECETAVNLLPDQPPTSIGALILRTRNCTPAEIPIWAALLGNVFERSRHEAHIQMLVDRIVVAEKTFRQQSLQAVDSLPFFDYTFPPGVGPILSTGSLSFKKDVDLTSLVHVIRDNLKCSKERLGLKAPTNRSLWRYLVQGLVYATLRDNSTFTKLCYRPSYATGPSDCTNVAAVSDWQSTCQIINLLVKLLGKWDSHERSDYVVIAGNTFSDAIKEARRDTSDCLKKRKGTAGKPLEFFDRLISSND